MTMYSYTIHRHTKNGSRSVATTIKTKGPLTPAEAVNRAHAYVVDGVAAFVTDDSGKSGWPALADGRPSAVGSYYDEDHEFFQHLDEGPVPL